MNIKKLTISILIASLSATAAYAAQTAEMQTKSDVKSSFNFVSEDGVSPYFLVFADCWSGLSDKGNGKLLCSGGTLVRDGYTAATLMELQKKQSDNTWSTIKSWSGKGGSQKSFGEYWYVSSGSYRVKTTHQAYQGSSLIEIFTSYSQTVII